MYQVTKEQVVEMTNATKRREFLEGYESWGVAHVDDYTSETYFECKLPDGSKIIACKRDVLKQGKYDNSPVVDYFLYKAVGGRTFRNLAASPCTIINKLKELRVQYTRKE